MAFRFTLQALLRLRESLEQAELQRLQAAAARVAHARAQVEQLDAEIAAARREEFETLSEGASGAELQFGALREQIYAQHRLVLTARLADLEHAREEQQHRYQNARQQREILASFRKRQLAAYELEQSRREQRELDELFLIRRGHAAQQ